MTTTDTPSRAKCACATNTDGTKTTFLCPLHAAEDPCHAKAIVTGKRRRGSIRNGRCSHCHWQARQ
jgi:hypothetical protein